MGSQLNSWKRTMQPKGRVTATSRQRADGKLMSVGYGVGRRAKSYLARRRYCCITGEWVADDPAAGVIVGAGMFGYKVALAHEFISALLHRAADLPFSAHLLPFVRRGSAG